MADKTGAVIEVRIDLLVPTIPWLRKEEIRKLQQIYREGRQDELDPAALILPSRQSREKYRLSEDHLLVGNGNCRAWLRLMEGYMTIPARMSNGDVNIFLPTLLHHTLQYGVRSFRDLTEAHILPEEEIGKRIETLFRSPL